MLAAVRVGESHYLGQNVKLVGAAAPHLGDREVRQHIQHLQHVHATGTRRRHRHDLVAAVIGTDCFPDGRLVSGQRLPVYQPAAGFHHGDDLVGDGALVECIRALVGDQLQRGRKVRLHEALAKFVQSAIGLIEVAAGCRVAAVALLAARKLRCQVMRHHDALARELDCGLEQAAPR